MKKHLLVVMLFFLLINFLIAQEEEKMEQGFEFSTIQEIKTTPVKNQARTGTCWTFSAISFIETEHMRLGGDSLDLSEMFIVRNIYPLKAERYVRLHGNSVFGPGSVFGDVLFCLKNYDVANILKIIIF